MMSRRGLLRLLSSTALGLSMPRRVVGQPGDRGIGGTGFTPGDDRGIGGTGVIGTIRKFGSIVVNDLRIAYAPDAEVTIDGRRATPTDLKIGQVVRVAALGANGGYSTRAIAVASEVVGPVERVSGRQWIVLGQTISTAAIKAPEVAIGDVVAIGGLRRNDGTIVASLVERRPGAPSRVAGPIDVGPDGALRVGNLVVSGASPDLIGRRAILEGSSEGGRFVVSHGTSEAALLQGVRALSLESYVERRGGVVSSGSGFALAETGAPAFPADRSVRAILTATVGEDGRLMLDSVRSGGRTYGEPSTGHDGPGGGGAGGSNTGRGGGGPGGSPHGGAPGSGSTGGRSPMDFGRDNRGPGGASPNGIGGGTGSPGGGGLPGGFGGSGSGGGLPGGLGNGGSGGFGGIGPGGRR